MSLATQSIYKESLRRAVGFKTRPIQIGKVWMGGDYPIAIQSMTTTDTMNIEATLRQVKDLADAGCQIVRITAPTVQDAEALKEIKERLLKEGYDIPLVADIHFVPAAAMVAADFVEKVRINPGNYADRKMFKTREYTDAEYQEELERIHEKFKPLVLKLKALGRALRIGTNHGSLSDRIMNRYGDTPEGMVESAFEFAEICRKYDFHNFCFSMKASNVGVMTKAYRLLVERQKEKGWDYPIHLGVTEAGDGEDGRYKSAIGIGTLLAEGIGDTIRVSLTETSVKEIPVARAIADRFPRLKPAIQSRYTVVETENTPKRAPEVWLKFSNLEDFKSQFLRTDLRPDVIYLENIEEVRDELHFLRLQLKTILKVEAFKLAARKTLDWWNDERTQKKILQNVDVLVSNDDESIDGKDSVRFYSSIEELRNETAIIPSKAILGWTGEGASLEWIIRASLNLGSAFVDLPLRGVLIDFPDIKACLQSSYAVLQATRRRMTKTEYISCPSCGRTLFDLEETTARIKNVTGHLKGVKIAVMGCIVNGPGEMADADFGYVGGAPGRVNLYVGKDCVERNIPSAEAPDRLVSLIKSNGQWIDPPGSFLG